MKTISVEELHEQTDRVIRQAGEETIVVTRNGRPQVILKPYPDDGALTRYWEEREQRLATLNAVRGVDLSGKPFPVRDPATLPPVAVETSSYISEDRDGR